MTRRHDKLLKERKRDWLTAENKRIHRKKVIKKIWQYIETFFVCVGAVGIGSFVIGAVGFFGWCAWGFIQLFF